MSAKTAEKTYKSGPSLQRPSAAANPDVTRALPNALGPEKSILSSMLQDPQRWIASSIEEKLTPEHFYLPSHGTLYKVLIELYEKGVPIELVALTQTLIDRGLLESIGGAAALAEIFTYTPHASHFAHHTELVKSKHILRSIIQSCTEAITRAYDDQESVPELLDEVEQKVLAIREGAEVNKAPTIRQSVVEVVTFFEEYLSGDRGMQGVPTGYADLDRMSSGLKPGEMFIIAARPSMGKTSFVMNIVEHVCIDLKKPTMVFSCEMSSFQIVQRLLFSRARFALSKVQKGFHPSKSDLQAIKRASEEISNAKLFIDDTAGITINELRAKARRKKKDEDIQLIAIDYLQLMRSKSKQAENSREREIAEISAGLKALAKELSIPVIVLAQLNRGPESRTGGAPRMSDLRESGSIEQDADLIGLLYRSAYYADSEEAREEEQGKAEIVIAKNRNGGTGSVPLTFIAELMRFESRAHDGTEEK